MNDKRLTVFIDERLHTAFKVKVAQAGTSQAVVLRALVADYVAGRVTVKTTKGKAKP